MILEEEAVVQLFELQALGVVSERTDDPESPAEKLCEHFFCDDEPGSRLFVAKVSGMLQSLPGDMDLTEKAYLWQRMDKYNKMVGKPVNIWENVAMALLSRAVAGLKEVLETEPALKSTASLRGKLLEEANRGSVRALCAAGYMMCRGYMFPKDAEKGVAYLRRAAEWNDRRSLVLLLSCDAARRQEYLARLEFLCAGDEETLKQIQNKCGKAERSAPPECAMLERLLGSKKSLRREVCSQAQARVISSSVIGVKDKERLLLACDEEAPQTGALPLALKGEAPRCNAAVLAECPALDEKARRAAAKALGDAAGKPLCFSCDSPVQTEMISGAIEKAFASAHVQKIEAGMCEAFEFEPSANNVFVRDCDEDRANVFIVSIDSETNERIAAQVKDFLREGKRRSFRLLSPNVSLDLSSVFPVCFCDGESEELLHSVCEIVRVKPLCAEDKPAFIKALWEEKSQNKVQLAPEVSAKLLEYGADDIAALIEKAAALSRGRKGQIRVRDLPWENHETGARKYGFGGMKNVG